MLMLFNVLLFSKLFSFSSLFIVIALIILFFGLSEMKKMKIKGLYLFTISLGYLIYISYHFFDTCNFQDFAGVMCFFGPTFALIYTPILILPWFYFRKFS